MANTKKAPAADITNTAAEVKTEPAKKTAEKKTSVKKTTEKAEPQKTVKADDVKPAAKKTAAKADAPADEKKAAPKKTAKVKALTLEDVVKQTKTKVNAADTTKVNRRIAATVSVDGAVYGEYYILLDENNVTAVEPYKYEDADLWIKGSAEDVLAVMSNKLKFVDAVSSGKITVWGNAEKAVIFVDAVF